jgi:hypothetical protein
MEPPLRKTPAYILEAAAAVADAVELDAAIVADALGVLADAAFVAEVAA